jgi:hypothetical protein
VGVLCGVAALALAWCVSGPHRALRAQQEGARPAAGDEAAPLVEAQLKLARRALRLIEQSREVGAPVASASQETT